MAKTVLVVLIGSKDSGSQDSRQVDHYQALQEEAARTEGARAGLEVEIVFAPGFDHLRVIGKRLRDAGRPPLDAVVVEPGSVSATSFLLKDLKKAATGLVLLNAWSDEVETYAKAWGAGLPFGTVSTNHARIGVIQGQQVTGMLSGQSHVLCVTGPMQSSSAVERLAGLKSALDPGMTLYEAEAGEWTEADGASAFERWYALFRSRTFVVDAIAAQSDELAIGAREASAAVTRPNHRDMFAKARFLGVDACPAFGRKRVASGELAASVSTPANTGEAIRYLVKFWATGEPVPIRAFTVPTPYPPSSLVSWPS
jgi:ABC-type sugar transport system substrate-binding protein